VVVLDTARADRLHLYGGPHDNSRQLEAVAAAGVTFEDVTTSSNWSWPSHATLFTGLPPWEHGARRTRGEGLEQSGFRISGMREDVPTLAEDFAGAGYDTALVSANPWLTPELGLVRGFQSTQVVYEDREVVRLAEEQMDGESVFLFVNLMSAHQPYVAAPAAWLDASRLDPAQAEPWILPLILDGEPRALSIYGKVPVPGGELPASMAALAGFMPIEDTEFLADLYDANLALVDVYLNQLLTQWTARHPGGIVLITSDHGEYLGEHGLLDHGFGLDPEVTRVPLVLAAPDRLDPGQRIATPVQLEGVRSTLLNLAGLSEAEGGLFEPTQVVRAASWVDGRVGDAAMPKFRHDLAFERKGTEVTWYDRVPFEISPPGPVPKSPQDAQLEALKALGYITQP